MLHSSARRTEFLQCLRERFLNAAARRRHRKGQRCAAVIAVEALEDRTLLTNFVVNTNTDDAGDVNGIVDGSVSLREAIMAAVTNTAFGDAPAGSASGDTITFAAGLANTTITVQSGTPFLIGNGDLTIDGGFLGITINGSGGNQFLQISKSDGSDTTIQGGLTFNNGLAILIQGNGTATLNDVTVSNSEGAEGGAIRVEGTVVVNANNLTLTGNESMGIGGGISLRGTNRLTLTNSTISNNRTVFTSFDDHNNDGGGLYIGPNATAEISNTTFTGNNTSGLFSGGQIANYGTLRLTGSTLTGTSPAPGFLDGVGGGGIINGDGATATITGSTITAMRARNGGGILNLGGTVTVDSTNITGNVSENDGGGIRSIGTAPVLIIRNASNISNNTAATGGGIDNRGRLAISGGVTISSNVANGSSGSGGGINSAGGAVTIFDSTISGNSANRAGGGIEFFTGVLEMTNSHLDGNMALGGGMSAPGNGGGLHVTGQQGVVGFVRIFGGTVSNNTAAREGGGLWNNAGNIMVVRQGAMVSGNTASGNAADDGGGGIFNNGGRLSIGEAAQILNNVADGDLGSGGGIFSTESGVSLAGGTVVRGNTAVRAGGGIEIVRGLLTVTGSTIDQNTALGGANPAAPGNGGGIHVTSATGFPRVDVINSVIDQNTAASEGGGLWMQSGSVALVRIGSQVTGNTAQGNAADNGGGGIFNAGGRLVINDATISGNAATGTQGSGGGIFHTSNTTTVENATVSNNTAVRAGGGIEVLVGIFESRNMLLTDNDALGGGVGAPSNGGGLHVTGGGTNRISIFGGQIVDNSATSEGGGLWSQNDSVLIVAQGVLVEGNSAGSGNAGNGGGGLFNNGGRVAITQSAILSNTANGNGGGILSTGGGLTVDNSTVGRNTATGAGGGLVSNGNLITANTTIAENRANSDGVGSELGGGILNGGTATVRNTVVAGNVTGPTQSLINDIAGNALDNGSRNTLVSDAGSAGGLMNGAGGHIVGVGGVGVRPFNTILNPLAPNGGPTNTYAAAPGSVIINAGNNAFARDVGGTPFTNDQRGFGFRRIAGGTVDMGAFEVQLP